MLTHMLMTQILHFNYWQDFSKKMIKWHNSYSANAKNTLQKQKKDFHVVVKEVQQHLAKQKQKY